MIECTGMTKVVVDSDLTETAIEEAMKIMDKKHYEKPTLLIVNEDNAYYAGKICQKYILGCIALPKNLIRSDAWILCGNYSGVWSNGA